MNEQGIPLTIEPIDPESHQVREVYAHFGLAVYHAQALERTLAMALATVYGPTKMTRQKYRALVESKYEKTLGQLVGEIRKTTNLPSNQTVLLKEALRKRNWLVHDYFWERAATFARQDGRGAMIRELNEAADFFLKVDKEFGRILRTWGEKRGVTQEQVNRAQKELLEMS
jgi:hypothetical protein